ncbi:hypothetical protein [Streptomyces lavendulocolor]|uniref:hypothetical protein n=1 Tax=Streptomyces lavendulocolor TaxID=67316 RepID=UPI003C2D39E6
MVPSLTRTTTPSSAHVFSQLATVRAGRRDTPLPRGCPAAAGLRRGGRFRGRDAERAQPLPLRLDTGVAP